MTQEDIRKRIADEQAKIEVPTYQDAAWDGAWKRRAGAMWGVAGVAAIVGALTGVIAPLTPVLVGMGLAEAVALIPTSVAVFTAIGTSTGLAIGAAVGGDAGAAASTMKEYERRQVSRDIKQAIEQNPDVSVEAIQEPVGQPEEDKEKSAKWSDYFNLRAAVTFATLGAIGGLIFATALTASGGAAMFAMPAMELLLGAAAQNAAMVTAYSMGLGAAFGLNFGVSHALITRKAVNFANDLLSGKALGAPWNVNVNDPDLKPVLVPELHQKAPARSMPVPEVQAEEEKACCYADKVTRAPDYESMVTQSIKDAENARLSV